jgi:hypothetical protein
MMTLDLEVRKARYQLMEQESIIVQMSNGDASLKRELADVSISIAELAAKTQLAKTKLAQFKELFENYRLLRQFETEKTIPLTVSIQSLSEQIFEIELQRDVAKMEFNRMQRQFEKLKSDRQDQAPQPKKSADK